MSLDSRLRLARKVGKGARLHPHEVPTICEALRLLRACERAEGADQAAEPPTMMRTVQGPPVPPLAAALGITGMIATGTQVQVGGDTFSLPPALWNLLVEGKLGIPFTVGLDLAAPLKEDMHGISIR